MKIGTKFERYFRDNDSQGFSTCFAILILFSTGLSLYTEFHECLFIIFFSFLLIGMHLYQGFLPQTLGNLLKRLYWIAIIPASLILGYWKYKQILYSGFNAIIYFQMVRGVTKVFTAGEHLINSTIVTFLLYFGNNSFSIESTVIFYPVILLYFYRWGCLQCFG